MSIICMRKFRRKIYLQWGLKIADFRSLCSMLAASMFHTCDLYVSCLRPLSTTHGYDKGRIAFWGARKRLGALAVLCGFERRACKHRGWEAGLKHRGWVRAFGLVLLVMLFVVRSSGRSFCGSFFWGLVCVFFRCFKFLRGVCGKVRGFLMQR